MSYEGVDFESVKSFEGIGAGYEQGLYETSATQNMPLGCVMELKDGRIFRYTQAGEALTAGWALGQKRSGFGIGKTADKLSAAAIGETRLSIGASANLASIPQDALRGGLFQVYNGTGKGYCYPVAANSATGTGTPTMDLVLAVPLVKALDNTSDFLVTGAKARNVVGADNTNDHVVGVAPIDVENQYFFWMQTRGAGLVLCGSGSNLPSKGQTIWRKAGEKGAVDNQGTQNPVGVALEAGVASSLLPSEIHLSWR